MEISRSYERQARAKHVAVLRFLDMDSAHIVQAIGKSAREPGRNVLHDDYAGRIAGKNAKNVRNGLRPARRGADSNDAIRQESRRGKRGGVRLLFWRNRRYRTRWDMPQTGCCCGADFDA